MSWIQQKFSPHANYTSQAFDGGQGLTSRRAIEYERFHFMERHSRLRTFRFSSSYHQSVLTDSLIEIQRLSDCKKASIANGKDPPLHSAQPRARLICKRWLVSTVYLSTYPCISRNACQLHRGKKYSTCFVRLFFNLSEAHFFRHCGVCGVLPHVVGKTIWSTLAGADDDPVRTTYQPMLTMLPLPLAQKTCTQRLVQETCSQKLNNDIRSMLCSQLHKNTFVGLSFWDACTHFEQGRGTSGSFSIGALAAGSNGSGAGAVGGASAARGVKGSSDLWFLAGHESSWIIVERLDHSESSWIIVENKVESSWNLVWKCSKYHWMCIYLKKKSDG